MSEMLSSAFRRKVTLEEWLDAAGKDAEKGVLTAVNCHHMLGVREGGGFQKGDEIDGIRFEPSKYWNPKDIADRIRGKAQIFAQDLRGSQTFKVFAYYGQAEYSASFHFEVIGRTAYEHGETETADDRGMRGQGMRLLEGISQQTLNERRETWNMMKHLAVQLKEDRDYYHSRALDAEGVVITMVREKIMDQNAQRMRELEFERSTEERKKLILLLPAILHHITGQRLVSDGMADTAILEAAAQHLRKMPPEEQSRALSAMPGELVMILAGRLKEISEKQEGEERALKLLAKVTSSEAKETDMVIAGGLKVVK